MAVNTRIKGFDCEYAEPYCGQTYGFTVYALDKKDCQRILDQIDLSTKLVSEYPRQEQHRIHTWAGRSQKKFESQIPKVLHHVCFVAHIASRYRNPSPHSGLLVADTGIVHSIAHLMQLGDVPTIHFETRRDVLVAKISNYERFVPFMWPEEERDL